ncbi:aspartate ammonia-lyase [Oceanobacillus neutriphilus]|uniref:Aspartate ammonia-lyase n=1 Tax=Oceanobacillus neutriphilus TaxID=531815 RepID=A0ABQ2P2T1_9BACI|nr:aspartate ammonia-lyase [Oceanobacillus neutriphilus]GGP16434.1 aspartate ammonia-lyase [Oceanobacillus neutriphilus]
MKKTGFRTEKDSLGQKTISQDAYYGVQTVRALENFPITEIPVHKELILALAEVKKAAALANMHTGMLPEAIGEAIVSAAEEVIEGKLLDQFVVDSIQGGAGTSINMNMNEVLANRALEILGKERGEYKFCSPNTHVNMSQSTNDTIPTALKIASYRMAQELITTLKRLEKELVKKEAEFQGVLKMGRTHLQDAVPILLGQEFSAYSEVIGRDIDRITQAAEAMLIVNIGATAVGTGLNAKPEYMEKAVTQLSAQLGVKLHSAKNLVDGTQNTDAYTALSASMKVLAMNMSKICNDLRLMASGPMTGLQEIILPAKQPGSSIMPGKVNPVMIEVVNQVAFQVAGNDQSICMASEAGQFELNVMGPVIIFNLLQSLKIMNNGLDVFTRYAVSDMEANVEKCREYVEESYGIITALNPHLGYETAAKVVKQAIETGLTIKEICKAHDLLSERELDTILDPNEMTTPGIAGNEFLVNK